MYPYEYIDSPARYLEEQLPSREEFYSSLTSERISENDYQHAQNVWRTFNCANLGDYTDVYLLTDILLLADIFEVGKNI